MTYIQFLKNDDNKSELLYYIADCVPVHYFGLGKFIFITKGCKVLTNHMISMEDCDHNETNSRTLLHIDHALKLDASIYKFVFMILIKLLLLLASFSDCKTLIN